MGKTTLHATRPARLSGANPAPALTQLATPSPQREILLVQPLPKIVGLRSWENTCQGAGSLAVGAGEAGFKGLTGGHEVNQRHHPSISKHTPDSWPGQHADHPRDAYRNFFFFCQKVTIYSTLHGAHPQTGPAVEIKEKNTLLQL